MLLKKNSIKPAHKSLKSKIIAGELKGRVILIPPDDTTRSTKNIIREALFNTIGSDIVGKVFVEVFAGSGSVGLEAVSRGAAFAYFIEKDKSSFGYLSENLLHLGVESKTKAYFADSFEKLDSIAEEIARLGQKAYFYFDPPFNIRENAENIYERCIEIASKLPQQTVKEVIFEHISNYKMPENIGELKLVKSRKFGKSSVSYYAVF